MTILIVDDEHFVIRGINSCVDWQGNGYETPLESHSGEQALAILESRPVDIVITDIRMAPMDGLTLLKEIKKRRYPCEVILLSCYNDYEYSREALRNGACDYLFKPEVMPADILAAVRDAGERLRARKAELSEARQAELSGARTPLTTAPNAARTPPTTAPAPAPFPSESPHPEAFEPRLSALLSLFDADRARAASERMRDVFAALGAQGEAEQAFLLELAARLLSRLAREGAQPLAGGAYTGLYALRGADAFERYLTDLASARPEENGRAEIRLARRYVLEHLGDHTLSLPCVAAHVGMSANYLSRLFREEQGEGFPQFVTRLRLEKARELKRATTLKVYEIADAAGFTDWRYMTRLYKRTFGIAITDER